jgi:hypothetical protein
MRRGKPVAPLAALNVKRKRIDPSALQGITDAVPMQTRPARLRSPDPRRRARLMLYMWEWLGEQDPDALAMSTRLCNDDLTVTPVSRVQVPHGGPVCHPICVGPACRRCSASRGTPERMKLACSRLK